MHSVRDLFALFTQTCEAQRCDRTQCVSLSWAHWQMQHSSCDFCQLLVCIMNLVKQGITEGTPACHNSTQSENGLFSVHDAEPQQQHFMIFWTIFWPSQKLWRSTGNATLFLQGNYHLLYQICTLFAKATARTVAFATVLGTFWIVSMKHYIGFILKIYWNKLHCNTETPKELELKSLKHINEQVNVCAFCLGDLWKCDKLRR